jgi:hypothetical protein
MKPSTLLIMVALVAVPGAPAVAKKHHSSPKFQPPGYAYAPGDRSEAIETCSVEAAKWRYSDWQTAQIAKYRACMTKHGQPFE